MAESNDRTRQRGYQRTYQASGKGRATKARYRAAHPEVHLGAQRRADARRSGPHRGLRRFHGMTLEDWQAIYDAQDGRCYLCGHELDPDARGRADPASPCVDHLHDHCSREKSCRACRRGIACHPCNIIIGLARDDPVLLHRIAEVLASANAAAAERIAAAPVQNRLFD